MFLKQESGHSFACSAFSGRFGQTTPPLVDFLKDILRRYPEGGQILKVNQKYFRLNNIKIVTTLDIGSIVLSSHYFILYSN